ncbi:adenylyltransferase/cytidyltransferase family protein [Pseudomonas sihuiensis]|uniref:Glycerol-3-phosphate cytidylyltransferase n=1 Tax=Pseudomonas sihuiensis TaxID=1274359 RepID=A0A1H2LPL1_9PSED|nr:Glycerol-3-phosphate cytidylyltransferase [Pseudomonas sihuiensis]
MAKTVITYGTFDMFHVGHLSLLRRLRDMGDQLIVAVSTDEFNAVKGKRTLVPYSQRAEIVSSIRYVDWVIAENDWEQKVDDVKKYAVDVFAIGDDWRGHFDFLKPYCEVVYLERTQGISSTDLKSSLEQMMMMSADELLKVFEVLELGRSRSSVLAKPR